MTITVRPEHEQLIVQAMQSGAYQNADDVIGRALEVLRSEDEWLDENKAAVNQKIERANGQFERGEYFSPAESRADMEKRKAAYMNMQTVTRRDLPYLPIFQYAMVEGTKAKLVGHEANVNTQTNTWNMNLWYWET